MAEWRILSDTKIGMNESVMDEAEIWCARSRGGIARGWMIVKGLTECFLIKSFRLIETPIQQAVQVHYIQHPSELKECRDIIYHDFPRGFDVFTNLRLKF